MCSLSWRVFEDHLCVVFNRDELHSRSRALQPQLFNSAQADYLMPKDPDGNGSWIAANEHGLVITLLNNYQGQLKPQSDELMSRGLLVKQAAKKKTIEQIAELMAGLELAQIQPFTLCVLSRNQQRMWQYDGIESQLTMQILPEHVFSSGDPLARESINLRHQYVKREVVDSVQQLLDFHQHHLDNPHHKGRFGLCMHREEGGTQSMCHVSVYSNETQFHYYDGPPCQTADYSEHIIKLKA